MSETEPRDETGIVALRTALKEEVPLPLGMRVAAVCAFVGGSSAVGLGAAAAPIVVTGTLASAAYALWLRNVLSPKVDRR